MAVKIRKIPLLLSLVLLVSTFSLSRGEQKPQWKGSITKEGDVVVVKNPKEPLYKGNILAFKEELSFGGAEAKPEQSFSEIGQILLDEENNIYVLDQKDANIKIFDRAGKYLRTIGKKGQGPGELSLPDRISLMKSKKEIMVSEGARRQLAYFTSDGKFLRSQSTGKMRGVLGKVDSVGNIIMTEIIITIPEMWYTVKRYDENMNLIAELARIKVAINPKVLNPFMSYPYWEIADNDNIVYGFSGTYELQIFNPQNKVIRKIEKEHDPVEVTEAARKQITKTSLPYGAKFEGSKYYPAFAEFSIDSQGRIFVGSWRKDKDGKARLFDIFDSEGRYLACQAIKGSGFVWRGNKLYSAEEDEEGYQVVKKYDVTWLIK